MPPSMTGTVDELSRTFAALADPSRRAMLERLAEGDLTVNELAEPFEMSLQAVSKHLRVLEDAGLVSKGRDGRSRPCHAELDTLSPALDWLAEHRQVWEDRLDRLGDHLRRLQRARAGTVTAATTPTPDTTTLTTQKAPTS